MSEFRIRRVSSGRLSSLLSGSDERTCGALLLAAAVYYFALLTHGHLQTFQGGLGLVFNSMFESLLHGQFDVDPSTIGTEGFVRDGHTYAYFGILPALLRAPLLLVPNGLAYNITSESSLIATLVAVWFNMRSAFAAYRASRAVSPRVLVLLLICILLGSAQVSFLRPSLYQEAVDWAFAFAAWFVYLAVCGLVVRREFATPLLCWMATACALTLLTRASTAIGLYAAIGLLMVRLVWAEASDRNGARWGVSVVARLGLAVLRPRVLLPIAILLAGCLATGFVNYERWGNPLTFADFRYYLYNLTIAPWRYEIESRGLFSLSRLWFGTQYYFLPIWAIIRSDGHFLLQEAQSRLTESSELPPSTFLLSDPLLLLFTGVLANRLFRARTRIAGVQAGLDTHATLALLLGLLIPCVMMLTAVGMAFRYRMEFYPFFYLAAFLGFYLFNADSLAGGRTTARPAGRSFGKVLVACTVVSVVTAHVLFMVYKLAHFGPAEQVLPAGWVGYYEEQVHLLLTKGTRD